MRSAGTDPTRPHPSQLSIDSQWRAGACRSSGRPRAPLVLPSVRCGDPRPLSTTSWRCCVATPSRSEGRSAPPPLSPLFAVHGASGPAGRRLRTAGVSPSEGSSSRDIIHTDTVLLLFFRRWRACVCHACVQQNRAHEMSPLKHNRQRKAVLHTAELRPCGHNPEALRIGGPRPQGVARRRWCPTPSPGTPSNPRGHEQTWISSHNTVPLPSPASLLASAQLGGPTFCKGVADS